MRDAELVLLARAGDRSAFAALLERHRDLLTGLVTRLVGDPALVEDAVQDAVLTALTNLNRLRDPAAFGPWLGGIGLNAGRRVLRARGRELSLDALLGGVDAARTVGVVPSAAEVAEAGLLAARVAAAVAALPAGQARAVGYFYLGGLSYAETAAHLGVPVGAVKTRLHKARRSLRSTLADLEPVKEHPVPVPMKITDVRRIPGGDGDEPRHVVLLAEDGGPATLQIWIGAHEASQLAVALGGVELPRPSSYRLTAALLATTSVRITDVTITDLVDGVFLAQVRTGDGATVDARPSDALNLALELDVPVYASPSMLDKRSRVIEGVGELGDGHRTLAESTVERMAGVLEQFRTE